MQVKVECKQDKCDQDIFESTGFQLIEGEVIIDDYGENIEQDEYHGIFCSKECLTRYLQNQGENR